MNLAKSLQSITLLVLTLVTTSSCSKAVKLYKTTAVGVVNKENNKTTNYLKPGATSEEVSLHYCESVTDFNLQFCKQMLEEYKQRKLKS